MIVHVVTNFTGSAGAETMLARLLRMSEADRTLVVSLMGISERNRMLAGNPTVRYRSLGVGSAAGLVAAVRPLANILRRERPAAVLCWMYHAMVVGALAARLAGCRARLFWNVRQSLDDPASLTTSTRVAVALARRLAHWPAGIVYNSARGLALHQTYGFRNDNSVLIPNGFDAAPATPLHAGRLDTLGIVARLHPQKDHATFFAAAAATHRTHPHARFAAAGAGMTAENPALAATIGRSGLPPEAIELRGEVGDMAAFYTGMHALVLSSRTEGFPNVVAEAMSYGRPAIVTDVGDSAAIVGSSGFVVPPADPPALAAAMRGFLDLSPQDYAARATAARERIATTFSLARAVESYGAVLSQRL
jgi:glycosyltransferase involved in cell wall biosynthesis